MHPDGQVVDDADAHPGVLGGALGFGELAGGQPGEAAVEVDPVQQVAPGAGGARGAGVAEGFGPGVPVGAVHLGERAPQGVVLQRLPLLGQEVAVGGAAAGGERHPDDQLQRLALQLPDGVPVDQRALVQHGLAEGGRVLAEVVQRGPVADVPVLRDRLDPQVHRVGEAAGGRAVRGRVGGTAGNGRVQRIDLDEPGAQSASGPGGEVRQVAEVAHAPGAGGEQGVELDEEAVGALGGLRDAGRGGDERGGGPPVVRRTDVDAVDAVGRRDPPGGDAGPGRSFAGGGFGGSDPGGGPAAPTPARASAAEGSATAAPGAPSVPAVAGAAWAAGRVTAGAAGRERMLSGAGGRPAGWRPGGPDASGSTVTVEPEGSEARAAGRGSPAQTTTVGGSRRERDSAATRDLRTSSGVPASTPSAASTAMTVSSGTDTVASGDGE